TLALEGVANEQDDAALRLDRELLAEPAVLRAGEAGHVDRGRDYFDPVGGNSVHPHEVVAHLVRDYGRVQVAARPELQPLDRPHGRDFRTEERSELRAGACSPVAPPCALGPARL